MTSWVALLRGVNVGGITVRNADLGDLFSRLGFESVRTVLASGNVAFDADEGVGSRAALTARIEAALQEGFHYDARIVLVTADELRSAIAQFPFDEHDASRQPWIIFCADEATRDDLIASADGVDKTADPVRPGPGVVYWNPRKGTSTSTPFAKTLARARYRSCTTNRNLRTARRIVG